MQNNICVDRRKVNLDLMCYLFLIFLTGCLVGWVYEEIFYWITEGLLRYSDRGEHPIFAGAV